MDFLDFLVLIVGNDKSNPGKVNCGCIALLFLFLLIIFLIIVS